MLRLITRECHLRPITVQECLLQSLGTDKIWSLNTRHVSNDSINQSNATVKVPESADVVIIGGGTAGCNTLYQLAKQGINVVMLERVKITAGATWHNTGLLWSLLPKDIETQLLKISKNLILRIHEETGVDPNWNNNGGIYVARTKERMEEYKRLSTIAKSFNVPVKLISPEETKELFPLMNTDVIKGALHSPSDGTADPSALCTALTTGALAAGAQVVENCPVSKILVSKNLWGSGRRQVKGVETPYGTIKTQCVVNCSGAWAPEVAKLAGLTLPLCSMKHTYVVSESIPSVQGLPNIRDPDASIYIRINKDNLFVGGFENNPIIINEMPKDFAFDLFELDWDMFHQHSKKAAELVPQFEKAGIKTSVCGPHCFTPDLLPLVGEDQRMRGMYHNVGFNSSGFMLSIACGEELAKWIINGRPELHMYKCDIRLVLDDSLQNKLKMLIGLSSVAMNAMLRNITLCIPMINHWLEGI
uniref:FAD dependent oxidoreductase domain-containing protein n=1 Tax=Clastoptera arizonana TaxID=38151 RepID=A0A1B6BWS7_9HEMI